MTNIKILVATHKPYWMPNESIYMPIHVGKKGKSDIGFVGDDTGNNISHKNSNYCELTALYWAWKNLEADYIGLVHYRRYFTTKTVFNVEKRKCQILSREDWERILAENPVVVADKRKYYIESNRSHYNHAHPRAGLDIVEQIITERYSDYRMYFDLVCNRTWAHMFNMFVMRQDLFNQYCEWLFLILTDLEKRLDISSYDNYQARVFGFVAERLLDVWLEKNQIKYKEQNISFMENQNWLKKGSIFLKRKVFGR